MPNNSLSEHIDNGGPSTGCCQATRTGNTDTNQITVSQQYRETLTRVGHEARAEPLASATQAGRQEPQGVYIRLAEKDTQLKRLLHADFCQLTCAAIGREMLLKHEGTRFAPGTLW